MCKQKVYSHIKKQSLINKIIQDAILQVGPRKPGYLIKKLSNEEKEILKTFKSQDFDRRI